MINTFWNLLLQWLSAGILQFSWWQDVIVVLVLTHITIASVTIFLHRSQAHRALDLHPIMSHFFRFWLWLTTGMVTKAWVAIHRKHHARCETEEDPHSPQVLGLKKVLFEGAELYRKAAKDKALVERYGHGTPNDWLERNLYMRFDTFGIFLMMSIDILLFGLPGLAMWAVQMIWIPFFAAGIINGVGHYFGYRNFECADASKNILPWGIIIGGEELHNNHHTYGSAAKLSVKKWEFDIGWTYICIMRAFGLAKVKRVPPKVAMDPSKSKVDSETLTAVLANRFQVMAHYSKDVINPVFQHEYRSAELKGRFMSRRVKRLLAREDSLVRAKDEAQLARAFEGHSRLATVYEYRQRLQAIWARTTASQKELVDAIKEWCVQAEATGIKVLHDFSGKLKTYVPQAVHS